MQMPRLKSWEGNKHCGFYLRKHDTTAVTISQLDLLAFFNFRMITLLAFLTAVNS